VISSNRQGFQGQEFDGMVSIRKTAGTIFAFAAALLMVGGSAAYAGDSDASDAVLAKVGTHKITEAEVDQKYRDEINNLNAQVYEVREHAIQAIAADQLMLQAAEKEHLSLDAYTAREVDAKVKEPTEDQVRRQYEVMKRQLPRPYEQEKPGIIELLKDQDRDALRQQLLTSLSNQIEIKNHLKSPVFNIPTSGHYSLGAKKAPVTIVEFGDFECPFTRQAEATLKQVRLKYGSKVRLVYFDFTQYEHKHAFQAALAARCAGDQGKFWEFHDALFADQSKLMPADLKATATKLKLDMAKFNSCFDQSKYGDDLARDVGEGRNLRIEGTPTFYINGRVLFGARPESDFDSMIAQALGTGNRKIARASD